MTGVYVSKKEALNHILLFHHSASNVAEQSQAELKHPGLSDERRKHLEAIIKNGMIRMQVLNWMIRHFDHVYDTLDDD